MGMKGPSGRPKAQNLQSLMELLLSTKELERLADLVRQSKDSVIEGLSHYATEPVAQQLEEPTPTSRPACGARRGCGSSMPRRASTTPAALSNFRERQALLWSARGSSRSGRRRCIRCAPTTTAKTGFLSGSSVWSRARAAR